MDFPSSAAMSPGELVDTCYHEAAHAVIALAVRGYVNFVEIGLHSYMGMTAGGGCSWGSDSKLDLDDVYAIFAAGYVSDVRRGASPEEADQWSAGDRIDLRNFLELSDGVFLTETGREIRFRHGVVRASILMDKRHINRAWKKLGNELVVEYQSGNPRVFGPSVERLVKPILFPLP
jgi:hypothetical protein